MQTLWLSLTLWLSPVPPEPPPLLGLERFPNFECCEAGYEQAYRFEREVEDRIKYRAASWQNYDEAYSYARRSRHVWLECYIVRNECAALDERLESLAALHTLLGEEDFWLGRMPLPVPLWACEEK